MKEGSRVVVHYQCKYRGLSVVDTLSARVLGGNRTVAEVRRIGVEKVEGGENLACWCAWLECHACACAQKLTWLAPLPLPAAV